MYVECPECCCYQLVFCRTPVDRDCPEGSLPNGCISIKDFNCFCWERNDVRNKSHKGGKEEKWEFIRHKNCHKNCYKNCQNQRQTCTRKEVSHTSLLPILLSITLREIEQTFVLIFGRVFLCFCPFVLGRSQFFRCTSSWFILKEKKGRKGNRSISHCYHLTKFNFLLVDKNRCPTYLLY